MAETIAKQEHFSGYDLNHKILPDLDLKEFNSLQNLCDTIGLADISEYFWMGYRFETDPTPLTLVGQSDVTGLHHLAVLRHEIGG